MLDRIGRFIKAERGRLVPIWVGIVVFGLFVIASTVWTMPHIKTGEDWDEFWIGVTGSFWEDAIFLLCVGIFATLISVNRPEEGVIQSRIKWFFNGKNVSEKILVYLTDEMKNVGLYSTYYSICITYSDYNVALDSLKATVQSDRVMKNMFTDQAFSGKEHTIRIATDKVGATPTVQGEFLSSYVGGVIPQHSTNPPISIMEDGYSDVIRYDLAKDSQTVLGYRFWIWHKTGSGYTVTPTLYAEQIKLRIVNDTGRNLEIDCDKAKARIVLTPGGERSYEFVDIPIGVRNTPFTLVGVN